MDKVRESYLDLSTILIHRVKTNLTADEVCLLQFAPIKLILNATRTQLNTDVENVTTKLSELKQKGSTEALSSDQRLFWLKKNYDAILYSVNKQISAHLLRAEERQLNIVREQFLGRKFEFMPEALFNSLLFTSKLSALPILFNEFSMWSWNGENSGFVNLNFKLEKLLNKTIDELQVVALRDSGEAASTTEIHDDLGGLFKTQDFMGPAADSKTRLEEGLCWFEIPENVDTLFNINKNRSMLAGNRKELGFKLWWQRRGELDRLEKTLNRFVKLVKKDKLLPQLLATHYMRRSLNPLILETVDLKLVCQFLCGQTDIEKIQASISSESKLSAEQVKSLESLRVQIKEQISKSDNVDALKLILDISQYRKQLKFYLLAHHAFNRLSLRTDEDELKLSQSACTLCSLPTQGEIEEEEEKICHHAIMKADVRGSTTVTDELQNKGLNPASYFSMRFFNPINKILETYGANKVFIEGDAIILSFLEYENSPQQWFSVARSCGYARDMLKIVGSNNRYSTQMGLPLLKLGVGICYSSEAPAYLYDEDKPIMISGAIGLADRMSSCSWNLREKL